MSLKDVCREGRGVYRESVWEKWEEGEECMREEVCVCIYMCDEI